MKEVTKNILLITLLILINLAIFLFCWLMTDEGNYLWYKTSAEARNLVAAACLNIFRTKYFLYSNSINIGLLGTYILFASNRIWGAVLILIGFVVFFGGNVLFKEELVKNYYIIFQNQNVPEDFMTEPLKSAGPEIGRYIIEDIDVASSKRRKYAIRGAGEIHYTKVIGKLNSILHDWNEKSEMRVEAYFSLIKMNTATSGSYVRIFDGSAHPIADKEVMTLIRKKAISY